MPAIRPYHFAQFRAAGFLPYYRAIVAADGIVCFDFEDSIQAETEAATFCLKQVQRRQVRQLLQGPGLSADRLAVRINAPATPHYRSDLVALRGLPGLHAVFVPKVAHPDHLRQVLRELPLPVRHVVAVVETQAGFAALPELLALRDARLGLVAFGHCDYNLSLGNFPFHHQDSAPYWEWLAELDAHLLRAGRRLLNSPVLQLADAALFQEVLGRLRAYPSATGQITLCLSQTLACAAPASPAPARTLAARPPESVEPLRVRFEQARLPGRAFAVDATRRLISPHEYEAARWQPA
ncbi:MAG: aldolase/citrate lyase family protein [Bacteroidota bacterium]|nr:aldolase/citrate lyase family protein [Bacteroidota bacterium]